MLFLLFYKMDPPFRRQVRDQVSQQYHPSEELHGRIIFNGVMCSLNQTLTCTIRDDVISSVFEFVQRVAGSEG